MAIDIFAPFQFLRRKHWQTVLKARIGAQVSSSRGSSATMLREVWRAA